MGPEYNGADLKTSPPRTALGPDCNGDDLKTSPPRTARSDCYGDDRTTSLPRITKSNCNGDDRTTSPPRLAESDCNGDEKTTSPPRTTLGPNCNGDERTTSPPRTTLGPDCNSDERKTSPPRTTLGPDWKLDRRGSGRLFWRRDSASNLDATTPPQDRVKFRYDVEVLEFWEAETEKEEAESYEVRREALRTSRKPQPAPPIIFCVMCLVGIVLMIVYQWILSS